MEGHTLIDPVWAAKLREKYGIRWPVADYSADDCPHTECLHPECDCILSGPSAPVWEGK
jgi:hypothetical protein